MQVRFQRPLLLLYERYEKFKQEWIHQSAGNGRWTTKKKHMFVPCGLFRFLVIEATNQRQEKISFCNTWNNKISPAFNNNNKETVESRTAY